MENTWEDAREIYRDWWKDLPEDLILMARYIHGKEARSGGFASGYHSDILLACNDILRSRP